MVLRYSWARSYRVAAREAVEITWLAGVDTCLDRGDGRVGGGGGGGGRSGSGESAGEEDGGEAHLDVWLLEQEFTRSVLKVVS